MVLLDLVLVHLSIPVLEIRDRDKVKNEHKNDHGTFTHAWIVSAWSLVSSWFLASVSWWRRCTSLIVWWRHWRYFMLCWTSVTKSTMIMEHLLTVTSGYQPGTSGFMAPGGSAVLVPPWLRGVGTGATLRCVGHQWQSQQWSWNIYSRLVSWLLVAALYFLDCVVSALALHYAVLDINDKVNNYHGTFTHVLFVEHFIEPSLRWISVTKSKMIIEHLLTPDACQCGSLSCIGCQWQSQKWLLNIYSRRASVLDISDIVKYDR